MKDQLEHILGQRPYELIKNFNIPSGKHVVYTSTILRKDDIENPIYITHSSLPEIEDDIETEIINLNLEGEEDEYVIGDYMWTPINYSDITFTNLNPVNKLGDVYFITNDGIFELENVEVGSDTNLMFYDEAILIN
jgi:hypothetical protein